MWEKRKPTASLLRAYDISSTNGKAVYGSLAAALILAAFATLFDLAILAYFSVGIFWIAVIASGFSEKREAKKYTYFWGVLAVFLTLVAISEILSE